MFVLHIDLFLDYSSLPVMFYFPLSLSYSMPHTTAQLYLVLPEAISGAKLYFLHDPVMSTPLGYSPPIGSTNIYFLGRVWLWRFGPTLTIGWDS
jgi:hypothetical protein